MGPQKPVREACFGKSGESFAHVTRVFKSNPSAYRPWFGNSSQLIHSFIERDENQGQTIGVLENVISQIAEGTS
jgi:hypothetical protein